MRPVRLCDKSRVFSERELSDKIRLSLPNSAPANADRIFVWGSLGSRGDRQTAIVDDTSASRIDCLPYRVSRHRERAGWSGMMCG
jgi:hypothetical protein